MRKRGGFIIVFLLTTLAIITTSAGDVIAASCDDCHDINGDETHQAHLTASYGPLIASCDVCHDVNSFPDVHYPPRFSDGEYFAHTTVCNTCHSPGGDYDGVDGSNIGAKGNWDTGVYNGSALQAGKEKWCVGCHDDDPSMVNNVRAPNIAGNGVDYGYYKTGHGMHGNKKAITCLECHDRTLTHVDGEARTYDADADNYQAGYRLKSVDGEAPMDIPRTYPLPKFADQFRLCFSCHDSAAFSNWDNTSTNFRADVNDSCDPLDPTVYPEAGSGQGARFVNKHFLHLAKTTRVIYDSDFNGVSPDSAPSCPACHNVHGPRLKAEGGITHAPGMIRTGELIGRETSLNLDYFTSQCPDEITSPSNELFDATTGDSTGGSMFNDPTQFQNNWLRGGVCGMCHIMGEPYWREARDLNMVLKYNHATSAMT